MKKLPRLFTFIFLLLFNLVQAQNEVELEPVAPADTTLLPPPELPAGMSLESRAKVYEADESMSQGIQPAVVVETEINDNKLVEKEWKDFMKDYGGKTKKSKGGRGEFTTTGAEIVGVNGVGAMTVYAKCVTGSSGNSELMVWFDLGGEYLESNQKRQYQEAEQKLLKFAHQVKVENTRQELKGAEKNLNRMEGDMKTLIRQNEGYHKDIETYEKKIEEAKENILTNEEQQTDTNQKINLQKQLVEEIDRRLSILKKQ